MFAPPCAAAAAASLPASRPESKGTQPRLTSSATTKVPVCPYAPKTVTVRFEVIGALPLRGDRCATDLSVPRECMKQICSVSRETLVGFRRPDCDRVRVEGRLP